MTDSSTYEFDCDPTLTSCVLRNLTQTEVDSIVAEANRLINQWPASDSCHRIGEMILASLNQLRMVQYSWRNAHGQLIGGDYHPEGSIAGRFGRVHIAAGYDTLNPSYSRSQIDESVRHEFGHWLGLPQSDPNGLDPAQALSQRCAGHS